MKAPLELWLKSMKWMLYLFVPLFVLALPVLTITDAIWPSPLLEQVNSTELKGQFKICVGKSVNSTTINGETTMSNQASYIFIPSVFTKPEIVSITELRDTRGVRFDVSGSTLGLVFLSFFYGLAVWFSWKVLSKKLLTPCSLAR